MNNNNECLGDFSHKKIICRCNWWPLKHSKPNDPNQWFQFHFIILIMTKGATSNTYEHGSDGLSNNYISLYMLIVRLKIYLGRNSEKLRCLLLASTKSKTSTHLNLLMSIFLGSSDYQIMRPKGLQLFATINQVATLTSNDTKIRKTTKIL